MTLIYEPRFDDFCAINCEALPGIAAKFESYELPREDIAQEFCADQTVKRDYENLQYEGAGQLQRWCTNRIRFVAVALHRQLYGRDTQHGHCKRPIYPQRDDDALWDPMSGRRDAVEAAVFDESTQALEQSLKSLTDIQRTILIGRVLYGRSFQDLGEELSLPPETVRRIFHKTILQIRLENPDLFGDFPENEQDRGDS